MRRDDQDIKEIFGQSFPAPSQEQTKLSCERVLSRLRTATDVSEYTTDEFESNRLEHPSALIVAAIVAALVLGAFPLVWSYVSNSKVYAIVEKDGVSPYRLAAGEIVSTDVWTGAMLTLSDSSRVEMRSGSELLLERASDGLRIRLNQGSVIVNAAKQRDGHLFVQTKDVTVSVVGTIFLVSVEETGSRVAVLEGEVHVQQGAIGKSILRGQQFATNPSMESRTLSEQFGWSRHLAEYVAMLQPGPSAAARPAEKLPEAAAPQAQAAPQRPVVPSSRPQFEVASVKRNLSGSQAIRFGGTTGRYTATNASLRLLIQRAYQVEDFQISGEPSWINSENYDIEATTNPETSRQDMTGPMLQALLEDRFKLAVHGETKDSAVYFLTPVKTGLKLTVGSCLTREPNTPVPAGRRQFDYCGYFGIGDNNLRATSTRMETFANVLSMIMKRKVLDKTGYTNEFDAILKWTPDLSATTNADASPSIFTALEEQLGLKLESGRAPIDILVIDHVEHPSEN
jgi:uncharacterized protein (TIGR03435 family)